MCRYWSKWSLRAQVVALGWVCVLIATVGAAGVAYWAGPTDADDRQLLCFKVASATAGGGLLALALLAHVVGRLLRPLPLFGDAVETIASGATPPLPAATSRDVRQMNEAVMALVRATAERRAEFERSRADLLARTQTVDRLLEFSQTIQGAGKPDQVFDALAHFLETEFALSAVLVATHEPDALPATHLKACRPASLAQCPKGSERLGELEPTSCPCLRQNQPRQFRPACSPVRCGVERCLPLPESQAAYCIPFQVGRKVQAVVHMVLPPGEAWTEARRQLAQTYVNAAHSALVSLQLLADAEQQSMTDPLTGLYNRRSMDVLLAREVALAERYDRPLSVAVIDMDRFKQVNDTHGHAAGDHLLRTFADCVRITLRKTDLAFRQGGDEFVIALTQTPLAQAQQVVQKLRQAFAAVDFSDAITNLERQPTLSVGVAERSTALNLTTTAALLGAADQALYDAKARNRDCICAYEPKAA